MKKFVLVLTVMLLGSFGLLAQDDQVNGHSEIDMSYYGAQTGLSQLYRWRDMLKKQGYKQEVVYIQNAIDEIEQSIQERTIAEKIEKYKEEYKKMIGPKLRELNKIKEKLWQSETRAEVEYYMENLEKLLEGMRVHVKEVQEKIWPARKKVNDLWDKGVIQGAFKKGEIV